MKYRKAVCSLILIVSFSFCFLFSSPTLHVNASDEYTLIVLSQYNARMNIGDSFYLIAATSNGKLASFRSSDSSVASVNSYGKITAKKAGTVSIRAKSGKSEVTCKVKVIPTEITLSADSLSLENGATAHIAAITSNGSKVKWKSAKSSIVSVDTDGLITAKKPGETVITASADGTKVSCKVKVKKPKVTISEKQVTLFRNGTRQLQCTSTSTTKPVWRSNRSSVAKVDENGLVTAVKHGFATITVTVDGVSKTCDVIVEQPDVTLSSSEITLRVGESLKLIADVSSGNKPTWSSGNSAIAKVSSKGAVTALSPGKVWVYAAEDGIKARCRVIVTE